MRIDFDPRKSERNARGRGLPYTAVEGFDWEGAVFCQDERVDYPEPRFIGLGRIGSRVDVVCFPPVEGGVRVISLRKANRREVRRYETAIDG